MRSSAIIPIDLMAAANTRLEFNPDETPTGFGPGNFSIPLRSGTAEATHAGLSCGNVAGFLDLLLEMEASGDFPGLVVDYEGKPSTVPEEPASKADFKELVDNETLEWSDPTNWFENPVMKGDERTFNGKTWVSLMDTNVFEPPIGWREVVTEGYPEWVQPVGAVDAYKLGERVTYGGAVYENTGSDANVYAPGVFGWELITAAPQTDPEPTGYPEWSQPAGAHDAYKLNDIVTYQGETWQNTGSNSNAYAPDVWGWTKVS